MLVAQRLTDARPGELRKLKWSMVDWELKLWHFTAHKTSTTSSTPVARVIGKAFRDGKRCYYIDDSVYHTFSGIIFDHCQYRLKAFRKGATEICTVFGQTCDALDTLSLSEELPDLEIDDLVYAENIGAYSNASATHFNGFPPAKVIHMNQ